MHLVAEYNNVVVSTCTIIQKKINCNRKSKVFLINSHYGAMKEFNKKVKGGGCGASFNFLIGEKRVLTRSKLFVKLLHFYTIVMRVRSLLRDPACPCFGPAAGGCPAGIP